MMETPYVMDLHTHTLVSGHAYGTIREMAQAAAEKGLQVLGITEHAPGIPGTVDPFYYTNLSAIPRELYGVIILNGCEINMLDDGVLSLEDKFMSRMDYAIVGIHTLCYTDAGREKNTDNLIRCMSHPKVRFVSHPDDDHTPLDYERLVPAAKEYGVALEVNNNSLRKKPGRRINIRENYRTMLKLCMEYGVPVFASSDAHDPSRVADFDLCREVLADAKFDERLLLNTDTEKLWQFLGIESLEK